MAGLLYFGSRGRLPVIRQTEAAECGLACLAMISSYHGHRIDLNTLRRRHPVSLKGVTLRALIQVASQMDLACRPLRFELGQLRQLHLPGDRALGHEPFSGSEVGHATRNCGS